MALKNSVFVQSLVVGAVMFGSIVGAGFASGKEVWFYFAQFGWVCFPLILVAGVLMFLLGYKFLEFGKTNGIESVQQINRKLFGRLGVAGEIIFIISNVILLSSMFAGASSLFDIVLSSPAYRYASIITAVCAVVISWLGFNKMVKVNMLIVPLLVFVVGVAFMYCIGSSENFFVPVVNDVERLITSVFLCILYVCSNLYFAGFIFARLGKEYTHKVNFYGALIGSVFLVLCLLCMVISIYLNPYSSMSDMPLVYIANSIGHVFGIVTLVVVWLGILTTAVSLVYTISAWLDKYKIPFKFASIFVCILALIISGLGFGTIVSYCYPVMGVFGVIFMLKMLQTSKKIKKRCDKFDRIFTKKRIKKSADN